MILTYRQKRLFTFLLLLIFSVLPFCFAKDFNISVAVKGGSGKAKVVSPAVLSLENSRASVKITWSSSNYDYMIIDGKKYLNETAGAKSSFTFPITLTRPQIKALESSETNEADISFSVKVIADTLAMGSPHEIEYELFFGTQNSEEAESSAGKSKSRSLQHSAVRGSAPDFSSLKKTGTLNLLYAKEFTADFYGEYTLLSVNKGGSFLLVPQNASVPENLPVRTVILQKPLNKTYLVSSSAMDYIVKINALDSLRFSALKEKDWLIKEAASRMKTKSLLYAGKYNTPDYELLLSGNCNLAIENTMIYHNPGVKEKLEESGIPVLVEKSGYELNPLGKLEWIKFYGLLFDRPAEADSFFTSAIEKLPLLALADTQKTTAFFFVTSNGSVVIRENGDYISSMIKLAGGKYIPESTQKQKQAASTVTVQFEDFYRRAVNADILIYNGMIDKGLSKKADLLKKNPLFADFKAYKSSDIYTVDKRLFQFSTGTADFIQDVNKILSGSTQNLVFLTKIK